MPMQVRQPFGVLHVRVGDVATSIPPITEVHSLFPHSFTHIFSSCPAAAYSERKIAGLRSSIRTGKQFLPLSPFNTRRAGARTSRPAALGVSGVPPPPAVYDIKQVSSRLGLPPAEVRRAYEALQQMGGVHILNRRFPRQREQ